MIDQSPYGSPEKAYQNWRDRVAKFGIGSKLDVDIPNELKGLLPKTTMYDKWYGKGHWSSSTILSLSIGQGELGVTPLQMANITAILANRGFYYRPHLVKGIGEKKVIRPEFTKKNYVDVDPKYFPVVIEGMQKVVESGTGTPARIEGITICGKTGTVQNPHGKDHSVFFAFAPKDNPKIAIAVFVENAGFGATWAAPIASLMIEKYLRDSITRPKYYEDRIVNASLLPGDLFNASGNIKNKEQEKPKPTESKTGTKTSTPQPKPENKPTKSSVQTEKAVRK
jgi:penicillin-binding protein 2